MTLQDAMNHQVYAVLGNTTDPDKFAAKIKAGLLEKGYTAYGVGKELASPDEIPEDIDIIDVCMRADRALALLKATKKPCKGVVIQPGAESPELIAWLEERQIPFIQNCLLVGMREYPRK